MVRKNRLDVHQIDTTNLAVYRDSFDRVMELSGFQLKPVPGTNFVWEFQHPPTSERGRLLHVEGYLRDGNVSMSVNGIAYMITRQDYTLALVFPTSPRTVWLTESNHKVLPKDGQKAYPATWPKELVAKIIRFRFRKLVIIDESYLLQLIGLRAPLSHR